MSSIAPAGGGIPQDLLQCQKMAEAVPAPPSSVVRWVLLCLTFLLAAFLRAIYLREKSFWLDEWVSIGMARLEWSGLVHVISSIEVNMTLYHVLLKVWILLHDSDVFLRSLSVFIGLLTLPVVYRLGTVLFGWRAGLIATFLLTVNAFHIRYSQEVRSYCLVTFLAVCSSLFFVRMMRAPAGKNCLFYVLVSALAVYAHLFAVLVLASHGLSLVFLPRRQVRWRRLLVISGAMAALILPFVVFAATRDRGQINWIAATTPQAVQLLIRETVGYGRFWLPVVYAACCLIAARELLRQAREHGRGTPVWRYGLILLWLTFPTVAVLAASMVKPLLVNRYLIVSLPALALLAGAGVNLMKAGWLRYSVLIVLTGFSLVGVQGYFRNYTPPEGKRSEADQFRFPYLREESGREDWEAVAQSLHAQAGPQDALIVPFQFDTIPLDHYARRLSPRRDPTLVFPKRWHDRSSWSRRRPSLIGLPQAYRRVWVLMSNSQGRTYDEVLSSLNELYPLNRKQEFRGITLMLFSRRDPRNPALGGSVASPGGDYFFAARKRPNSRSDP